MPPVCHLLYSLKRRRIKTHTAHAYTPPIHTVQEEVSVQTQRHCTLAKCQVRAPLAKNLSRGLLFTLVSDLSRGRACALRARGRRGFLDFRGNHPLSPHGFLMRPATDCIRNFTLVDMERERRREAPLRREYQVFVVRPIAAVIWRISNHDAPPHCGLSARAPILPGFYSTPT